MPLDVRHEWPVQAAINSLDPEQTNRVLAALERLRIGDYHQMPNVRQLASNGRSGELFVMDAGGGLLITFSREPGGAINVQDVISRQFVETYG